MGHHLGLSQSRNGKGEQAEQGSQQHDTSHRLISLSPEVGRQTFPSRREELNAGGLNIS
jgi:hypothetical protein